MKIYSMIGSLVVTLALISYSIGFFKLAKKQTDILACNLVFLPSVCFSIFQQRL